MHDRVYSYLVDAGISSFKVEGRMKTTLYVATVARAYRKAIDDYFKIKIYDKNKTAYLEEVKRSKPAVYYRLFFGKPKHEDQIYDSNTYDRTYTYLGTILISQMDYIA